MVYDLYSPHFHTSYIATHKPPFICQIWDFVEQLTCLLLLTLPDFIKYQVSASNAYGCDICVFCYKDQFIHSLVLASQAGLAGTRVQSCDRYGSATLHPGQVLGGSLPLLSPAFRRSHFRHQVPVRPQQRERY